jgi:hypothetical protein
MGPGFAAAALAPAITLMFFAIATPAVALGVGLGWLIWG